MQLNPTKFELDYSDISNLWMEHNANQTAFLYYNGHDWIVISPCRWIDTKFSANTKEQGMEILKAIETLSNHYDPYR